MDISVGPAFVPELRDTAIIRLAQVVKVLRRHLPLIAVCTLAGLIGGYVYVRGLPKTYTASTSMTVEGDRIAIPELQGALRAENAPDPMPAVRTEAQALTSRALVQQVIGEMHLELDPEFNPALRPPPMMARVTAAVKSWMPDLGPPGDGKPGPAPGPDESVLGSVSKALAVFQDNRSLVISIAFTAEDPRLAARFVNTLVGDYIAARASRRVEANRGADTTLVTRIAEAKVGLEAIEKQMQDLRTRGDIVALRAGSVGQAQVEELASAAAHASVDRAQIEANWNRAIALSHQGSSDAMAGVLDSPTISRLRDQESVASSKMAELSSRYGPNYPGIHSAAADLQSVRAQLTSEMSRIVSSLGAQLKIARDKEADLQRQLAASRTAGVAGENARSQLEQLQKEADTRRALYQTLLEREQQTVALPVSAETPDVRILSAAVPPGSPSGPNMKLASGLGGMSGAVLGCLLALLRLKSVDGFSDAAEVTRLTGLPVLGTLPRSAGRRGLANRVLTTAHGPELDGLRDLRARLRFAGRVSSPRCVLFSSALERRRDASELATAFARLAAAGGERVLLIEADLGTPAVGRLLGVRSSGLVEVLRGGSDWREAAVADPHGPLDVLLSERNPPSASTLLSGVALQNMLVEARQQYDLVVLSGPRAEAVDVPVLALRADSTVLALDARAGRPAAASAVSRLAGHTGGPVCAVLVA